MKVGEVNAVHMSYFTSMAEIVKSIFPSGKDSKKSAPQEYTEDLSQASSEDFISRVNQLGRHK